MLPLPNIDLTAMIDTVIWGFRASEVTLAAKADLSAVLKELQGNWAIRWEAVGMLKYLFSCVTLPWELKQDGIRFLLCILDGSVSCSGNDYVDHSISMPTMYTSLQVVSHSLSSSFARSQIFFV